MTILTSKTHTKVGDSAKKMNAEKHKGTKVSQRHKKDARSMVFSQNLPNTFLCVCAVLSVFVFEKMRGYLADAYV